MEKIAVNIALFRLINSNHHPVLDTFFTYYRYLGTGWVLIPTLVFLFAYRRWKIKPLLIAVAAETVVVHVLKQLISQPRPAVELANVHLLQHLRVHSFPSGDAALAFAIAAVVCRSESRVTQIALFSYAALVAYERVYLGVHFPLDVAVGALIGVLCAALPHVRLRPSRAAGQAASRASGLAEPPRQANVE